MTKSLTIQLEPLRQALIRRAETTADATLAKAEHEARAIIDAARQDAAATLAKARADGEADAAQLQAEDRGRARRAARGIVLGAQRAVYDELRRQSQLAVRELVADPDVHRRLAAMVRTQLGPHAIVRDYPTGGVVAEAPGGRRIDASVDLLVERALMQLDLDPLWVPG